MLSQTVHVSHVNPPISHRNRNLLKFRENKLEIQIDLMCNSQPPYQFSETKAIHYNTHGCLVGWANGRKQDNNDLFVAISAIIRPQQEFQLF